MRVMRLRATHETQNDYCGLMTLVRLIETHRDCWGIIRLRKSTVDSSDSGRLTETQESHGDS